MMRINQPPKGISRVKKARQARRQLLKREKLPRVSSQYDTLDQKGYQVVSGVLNQEEVRQASTGFDNWLEGLGTGIQIGDPNTWTVEAWPRTTHGIILYPCIAHEQFIWDVRQNPKVHQAFSKLWGDTNLHVSFDRACIMKPPEEMKRWSPYKPWPHIDQGPMKQGRHCIQGLIPVVDMSSNDGTLFVLEGSHRYHTEFYQTFPDKAKQVGSKDWCKLSEEEYQWYLSRPGVQEVRINAQAGDLVLWDSRTVHCNTNPVRGRIEPRWRKVIYVSMGPASQTDEKQRIKKKQALENLRATSHWPNHIRLFPTKPQTYGANLDHYKVQSVPPVLTPLGQKLAGLN